MSRIAALGEMSRIRGYGIAGVEVLPAGTPEAAVAAWRTLPSHVALLILTPLAAAALAGVMSERPDVLVAVLP